MGLVLAAVDVAGPLRWRWRLSDAGTGAMLADHEVDLAAPDRGTGIGGLTGKAAVAAFGDLYGYARAYAVPDRRLADETRYLAQAGEWAGRVLLGEPVAAAIAAAAPVTVRVLIPPADDRQADAGGLPLWPLELAHHRGVPLAARGDVAFVYDIAAQGAGQPSPASGEPGTGPLRILAVFSQPTKTSVLALRRERYALSRLIREGVARRRAAVELRVVQYGVTRERLSEIAADGDGWDILHLSGHGGVAGFLLERQDGTSDPVATDDLVALLRPARPRVSLAVVSACESAAEVTAQTYRLLGLTDQAESLEAEARKTRYPDAEDLGAAESGDTATAADDPGGAARSGAESAGAAVPGDGPDDDATAPGGEPTGPAEPVAELDGLADRTDQDATDQAAAGREPVPVQSLARSLLTELGCAVVGMRFPVVDEFAVGFAGEFYERLLSRGQAVDAAVAAALPAAAGEKPSAARPPISLATPVILGTRAIGLRLRAPRADPDLGFGGIQMQGFPPEPPRFVGRAEAMARASAALAAGSGTTAVLLHGMAGAGKTACAVELAYRHEDAFATTAFWQAPANADDDWGDALPSLAAALDIQLGRYGFQMSPYITTVESLGRLLPLLRRLLETSGILLVLDNLETLLTSAGSWRDPRWAALSRALTAHDGESRVILTSRIPPSTFAASPDDPSGRAPRASLGSPVEAAAPAVLTLPVHALSLDESVALARELPNLGNLVHADETPLRPAPARSPAQAIANPSEREITADRARVRRVLRVVQGHPKLMELADAMAADRARLDTQLQAAEAAAGQAAGTGRGLDAFFRVGESTLGAGEFLTALAGWTAGALGTLSPEARLVAEFVACLEEGDRRSDVIEATWAALWRRLGRAGDPAEPGPLLAALAGAALVEAETVPAAGVAGRAGGGGPPGEDGPVSWGHHEATAHVGGGDEAGGGGLASPGQRDGVVTGRRLVVLRVHPGVAAAVAGAAGPGVRAAVDAELAQFWAAVSRWAREREGGEDSGLVVAAGLAAAPYLLRRGDWDTAGFLLEQATVRDGSPGTVQAALPSLRRIAAATGLPAATGRLARVLRRVDRGEAERLRRGVLDDSAAAGDFRVASAAAGDLCNLLMEAGRLREALAAAERKQEYSERAGLGPWTRLLDQAQRLQVLGLMGEHARVLAETEELRAAMAALPARPGPGEAVDPWHVRELILGTGRSSALAAGDWARCLELNAEVVASKRARGAGVHEVTRFRFNDAWPLMRLGRLEDAGRLLGECQRVFEDHADTARLARVLSNRASLEDALGRVSAAAELERAALRLRYARPELRDIAVGHHNLASSLWELEGDPAGQRAHRLAAALLYQLAGMAHDLADTMRVLAAESRAGGGDPSLPTTLAQVIEAADCTEGVRLGALLAAIEPDVQVIEQALADILRTAANLPPEDSEPDPARYLREWEPYVTAIATACRTGQQPPAELLEELDNLANSADWSALAAALRRILSGERAEATLLTGLDPIDTAIAREILARIVASAEDSA